MAVLLDIHNDEEVRRHCAVFDNRSDALLEILHKVQSRQKYLSEAALRTIADCLNISRAEVHGVVTFYHDFKQQSPAGIVLKICRAEACQAVGGEALFDYAKRKYTDVPAVDVEAVYCVGNCALGPAALVGNKLKGRLNNDRLVNIVSSESDELSKR